MIWIISWRNVWRSKVRSLVIIVAVAIGIFAGVFSWAFYYGMVDQRMETAIKTEVSHIQIHQGKYLQNPDIANLIPDIKEKKERIDTMNVVHSTSVRIIQNGMVTSAETGSGITIMGIVAEEEKQVTNLFTKVIEGQYLEGVKRNPIVIGHELAEKLNVKLHSKLVVTMQQLDGTMTSSLFRIAGIFKTSNSMFDETNAFVKAEDLRRITNMNNDQGHEIAVLLNENSAVKETVSHLSREFPGFDVKSWREIMPEVSLLERSMDVSMYFILIIILLALGFGIVNTMLMAVLDRVKELGMLMSVGMNKRRIFFMIMLETVFLSLTGGVAGIIVGYAVSAITSATGIDLASLSQGIERLGFESVVYPVIDIGIILKVTILVIITGLVAAIYPAIKAIKMRPAEALRIDM